MDIIGFKEKIIDMVVEQQLKLGYIRETVRLYYPLGSLNSMLDTKLSEAEMIGTLTDIAESTFTEYGKVGVSVNDGRFCLALSPEVSEKVHCKLMGDVPDKYRFLSELIQTLSQHDTHLQEIVTLFESYAGEGRVVFETMHDEEFDYLLYFESGQPDEYRYCLTDEGCHMTYHRFTGDDYEEIR